jgi:small subunit ribosomal protein S7
VQIEGPRRQSLAMRWLLTSARGRPGKSMQEKLANELLDAFNNTGATIKRREDTHRMAEANRAFSHYGRF